MSDCLVAYLVMALAVACSAIVGIPQPSAAPPILLLTNNTILLTPILLLTNNTILLSAILLLTNNTILLLTNNRATRLAQPVASWQGACDDFSILI